MKIEVNLEKKSLLVILVAVFIIAGALFVYAYTNVPNPGHGASSVVVTIGDAEMTLQEAIDNSKLIVNGSGILLSKVNGQTMINATAVKLQTSVYKCGPVGVNQQYSASTYSSTCTGYLTTEQTCCDALLINGGSCVHTYTCSSLGYLVQ